MIKVKNNFFYYLVFAMACVVALSNYLVQFPINRFGLQNLLTYGALSYPVAFLITDLSNRMYGKDFAKKIVYLGFALPCQISQGFFFFSNKKNTKNKQKKHFFFKKKKQKKSSKFTNSQSKRHPVIGPNYAIEAEF